MKRKNLYNIETPFFPGFYESSYLASDTVSNEVSCDMGYWRSLYGQKITEDDLDIRYGKYTKAVARKHVEVVFSRLNECYPGLVKRATFKSIWSPQYYNYQTDRVYSNVTLCEGWRDVVFKFMTDNQDRVTMFIKRDWTARSGFIPFLSDTFQAWWDEFGKEDPDPRYISEILGYMLLAEDDEIRWSIWDDTMERINVSDYIKCIKKVTRKSSQRIEREIIDIMNECGEWNEKGETDDLADHDYVSLRFTWNYWDEGDTEHDEENCHVRVLHTMRREEQDKLTLVWDDGCSEAFETLERQLQVALYEEIISWLSDLDNVVKM